MLKLLIIAIVLYVGIVIYSKFFMNKTFKEGLNSLIEAIKSKFKKSA